MREARLDLRLELEQLPAIRPFLVIGCASPALLPPTEPPSFVRSVEEPAPMPGAVGSPADAIFAYLAHAREAEAQIAQGIAAARESRDIVLLVCLSERAMVVASDLDLLEEAVSRLPDLDAAAAQREAESARGTALTAHRMQLEAAHCLGDAQFEAGPTRARVRASESLKWGCRGRAR